MFTLTAKYFDYVDNQLNSDQYIDGAKEKDSRNYRAQNFWWNLAKEWHRRIAQCKHEHQTCENIPFATDNAANNLFSQRYNKPQTINHQ